MDVHAVDASEFFLREYDWHAEDFKEKTGHVGVEALSENELRYLAATGAQEAWYWYITAPYVGHGAILLRRGEEWAAKDMGHCSCFGPLDFGNYGTVNAPWDDDEYEEPSPEWLGEWRWFPTLDELKASGSDEWWGPIGELVKAARP